MHCKLRHNRLLSRDASNLGIFALECAVDIRVGLEEVYSWRAATAMSPVKRSFLQTFKSFIS